MKVVYHSTSAEDLFRYRLPVARRLRDAGYTIIFAGPGGEFAAGIEQEGFGYERIPPSLTGKGVLYDVAAGLRLGAVYRRLRPDIVHHFTLHGLVTGAIAARRGHVEWVVQSVPPLLEKTRTSRLLRVGGRRLLALALKGAEVTFRTLDDRQLLLSHGLVRPEQTHIIASTGIDLAAYAFRGEPRRTPVAALIGPLQDGDLIESFVYAARQLRAESVDARFVLIATTRSSPAVPQSTLDDWVEKGFVEWWGRRGSMASTLENVHVACVLEPASPKTPHLLLEVAACGRPIVAVDHHAARSLVRDGETGHLIPEPASNVLAEALHALLTNDDRRRGMGRNVRKLVETEYSADRIAQQTLAVYERLFERGREI